MVSQAQKDVIKASWSGINKQAAGTAFYVKLHDHVRNVYDVFHLGENPLGPTAQLQGLKVMKFVDLIVQHIDNMDFVEEKIGELATRHIGYHAKKSHFKLAKVYFEAAVGEAMGNKFDAAAQSAWPVFYDFIADGISAPLDD